MRYRVKENILWKIVDLEAVIVDPGREEYYFLNPTGTDIWEMMSMGRSFDEIRGELCGRYEVSPGEAEKDLRDLTSELKERGLIEEETSDGK